MIPEVSEGGVGVIFTCEVVLTFPRPWTHAPASLDHGATIQPLQSASFSSSVVPELSEGGARCYFTCEDALFRL